MLFSTSIRHLDLTGTDSTLGETMFELVTRGGYAFFNQLCNGQIVGGEHIQRAKQSGFVMAPNHVSYLDWIVLWTYLERVHGIRATFLAKERLFRSALWGPIMARGNAIAVSDDGKHLLDPDAKRRLAAARHIVIFPEGRRSPTGKLLPAKPGAVKIAHATGLPLLPVGLRGFFEAWPPHRALPLPHRCSMHFGEAFQAPLDQTHALYQLMAAIRELSTEAT